MAKTKISEYSSTANSNTDIASINIDEGCAPSGINNAIRALMAQLKDFQTGAAGDPVTVGDVLTVKGASINDTNGNELFKLTATASAVNELTIANAATGGSPTISATGGDTNIGINLTPKGSGNVSVSSGNLSFATTGQRIAGDFSNATQANKVMFQSSTSNGNTNVGFLPNGTATQTVVQLHNNADPTNAGIGQLITNTTDISFRSAITGTGTYLPMTFYTGGSERMRIDTSGNVGIGTSSPAGKLDVYNTTAAVAYVRTANQTLKLAADDAGSRVDLANVAGSPLTFTIGITERARIDSSGNLLVGTTVVPSSGNTNGAYIYGSGQAQFFQSGTSALILNRLSNTGSILDFRQGSSTVGSVSVTASTTAYNTSSDYRLKENIAPMTGALSVVSSLKPCTYKWKTDGSDGQGFIAHELQEVVPECVTGEKDAVDENGNPVYQGIDTSFLVATLTAAIQELKAELDAAKADIAALKGQA